VYNVEHYVEQTLLIGIEPANVLLGYWIGVWNVEIAVDSGVVSEDCSGYWSGEWSLVKSGLESLVDRGMEGGVEREEWRLKSGECRVENG